MVARATRALPPPAVGANAVWVTNNYGGTVSRVDPAVDRVVQTIPVDNAPTGVGRGRRSGVGGQLE